MLKATLDMYIKSIFSICYPLLCLLVISPANIAHAEPITPSHNETLEFIVANSDLIAIVNISGGTNKRRPFFSKDIPSKVTAKIFSVVKGEEKKDKIEIIPSPMFLTPGTVKSKVILRNGRHLVFLSNKNNEYQPTTIFSLLDIFKNHVYPIWKESESENEITSGYDLNLVIKEIQKEIKRQEMLTRRLS